MKNWLKVSALGAAIGAVSVAAWAVSISNLSGQSCGGFSGNWHFVNNQTGTTTPGTLTATWDSGDSCTVAASKVTPGGTQHFNCTASGALTSASTNLGGRLVLSDFSCETKEPPPCDPKKEICK